MRLRAGSASMHGWGPVGTAVAQRSDCKTGMVYRACLAQGRITVWHAPRGTYCDPPRRSALLACQGHNTERLPALLAEQGHNTERHKLRVEPSLCCVKGASP